MYRIRRFGVVRTANVFAILYFLITLIFVIPFALILASAGTITTTDQFGNTVSVGTGLSWIFLLISQFSTPFLAGSSPRSSASCTTSRRVSSAASRSTSRVARRLRWQRCSPRRRDPREGRARRHRLDSGLPEPAPLELRCEESA